MTRIEDPKPLRWNKRRFHRLLDVFGVDRLRLELVDGELIQMPPQNEPHTFAILQTELALRKALGSRFVLRTQMPLDLAGPHEPESDILAVRGSLRDHRKHPKRADLIVEVSDSTLRYDRMRKGSLYASAGIRDYWIVNLLDRQLEIRRNPQTDFEAEFGHSYEDVTVHQPRELVSLLAAPKARIKVADLLP
jgi:Uma2 family endonuclease